MQFLEGWSKPRDGGLLFEDPELLRRQKGVLMDVLRDFGAQVLCLYFFPFSCFNVFFRL